jgi:hypothetical protein
VRVHGVRGARDAVEIEADAYFGPDRHDVGEGGLRQTLAAQLLPGELRPRQAAFGHVRLELGRLPAALDLKVANGAAGRSWCTRATGCPNCGRKTPIITVDDVPDCGGERNVRPV